MTQQTINVGAAPNDGTGDPLRTAFTKCNANFSDLYSGGLSGLVVGISPIAGGISGNMLFDNAGKIGEYTSTQVTAWLGQFTSGLQGLVPPSGGGTLNFLRADGTWNTAQTHGRVTADFAITSSVTLTNVPGLSVNVAAGVTYAFTVELSVTDAAAGGVQVAISGTATATNIIYGGWIIDSGANGIKGMVQATAMGIAVANAPTTGTAVHVTVHGTITVNAAGTLTVQAAQSVSNATATTIKQGSRFTVFPMP